ncbi:SLAM family member 9-like, partial [Cetorhinus maximus]
MERGRITLNPSLLELELNSLQHSDQGRYQIEAGGEWKIDHGEEFDLRLSEAVPQPIIQMRNFSANGTCHVRLKCMVENGSNVTFTWQLAGSDLTAKESGDTLRGKWKTLEIKVSPNFTQSYSCTARNPGCNQTVTIHLNNTCSHGEDTDTGE